MAEINKKIFIPEITLGHIIQIFGMLITVSAIYYKMDARIARLEEMFRDNSTLVQAINANQSALIKSIAVLEERTSHAK